LKLPVALDAIVVRFDRLSLRERLLIFAAVLGGVFGLWQTTLMEPLSRREKVLLQELTDLQATVSRTSHATESVAASDPTTVAMARLADQQKALDAINRKLAAESAGLIPPAQMVEVIHDVLRHQRGVALVSLKNLPVIELAPPAARKDAGAASEGAANGTSNPSADADNAQPAAGDDATTEAASARAPNMAPQPQGPYLHPVELVVEGRYVDVVAYLRELESLPWHFYWRVLELETRQYPLNRVRIELSTVSLDKEWIGV
jgi:MSHA biogenesis protein MshJ